MQIDTDLVFDNLEQSNVRNHDRHPRIERDVSPEEADPSPSAEEHDNWLIGGVKRLKRSISNLFNGNEEHGKKPAAHHVKGGEHRAVKKAQKSHGRSKKVSKRKHRQAGPLGQQEADDYDDVSTLIDSVLENIIISYLGS